MTTDDPLRVVVVTWQAGEHLGTFLDTLAAATRCPLDVVVADNGSTDGAPELAGARGQVQVLSWGRNLGYGQAANRAAAAPGPGAGSPWLLVSNPDVVFEPGALDALLAAAARHPQAAALGPAIRTPDGDLYPSARQFPSLRRGVGHALLGWWWPTNPWTAAYRSEQGEPREGSTGWLSGSCLLLRRDAFERVGGFDPRFFMYFEDTELCRRLYEEGLERVYVPSAVVTHTGGHATSRRPVRMLAHHHRSAYRYVAGRYPGPAGAPLRLVMAVGLLVRFCLGVLLRRVGEGARPTRRAAVLPQGAGRPAGDEL